VRNEFIGPKNGRLVTTAVDQPTSRSVATVWKRGAIRSCSNCNLQLQTTAMEVSKLQIRSLAEHPDFAPTLAWWHYSEWHHLYRGWSFEQALVDLRAHDSPNRIPTTWIAVADADELLGSVSLVIEDLPDYQHLSPWLASLFVRPDRRGNGIGGALIRWAVSEARRLGVARLYLFTPNHESYYAARGWLLLEHGQAAGQPVAIMSRETKS
jgi:GNAT superfamily N-acetyltransferase